MDYLLGLSIPVPSNGHIAWIAQAEDDLCKAIGVAVAQEEGAVAIDSNRVGAIPVPVACHRLVAGQAIIQRDIGKTRFICVLQEDHPVARAEDAGRIDAIPIPIPGNAHIPNVPQVEVSVV